MEKHQPMVGASPRWSTLLEIAFRQSESGRQARQALTAAWTELAETGVSTRMPSAIADVIRSIELQRRTAAPAPDLAPVPVVEPANKLTTIERRRGRKIRGSDRFVDQAPLKVYAQILDKRIYVCSVSTTYRALRENAQFAERRRLAPHTAKACPELVATAPRQMYSWDITKLADDAYAMIDIYSLHRRC